MKIRVLASSVVFACVLTMAPGVSYALIDINTADLAALDTLPGIGATLAQRIIDYRTISPFSAISDIKKVNGIGDSIYNNIKDLITVSTQSPPPESATTTESDQTGTSPDPATTTASTSAASASGAAVPSYVPPPVPQIFADGGDDRTVITGADIEFEGRAYNRDQEFVDNVRFVWNFGDGSTAEGGSVRHHFSYPGRYFVSLSVAHDRSAASDYMIISAEPANLAFNTHGDGSVSIENLSGRELDLSFWHIRSFVSTFSFPEGTRILEGETLRIPQKTLGFYSLDTSAELLYPNGVVALRAGELFEAAAVAVPEALVAHSPPAAARAPQQAPIQPVAQQAEEEPVPEEDNQDETPRSAQTAAVASAISGGAYWWLGACAFALIVGATAMLIRRRQRSEWNIIEES